MSDRHGPSPRASPYTLPPHTHSSIGLFKVYVDDFILVLSFDRSKGTDDQIVMRVKGAYTRLAEKIRESEGNFAVGKGKVAATDNAIANRIADSLNVCQCGAQDKMSEQCTCHTNHEIAARKSLTVLGVDYSVGRPATFEKNNVIIGNANDKPAKILTLGKGGPRLRHSMGVG